MHKFLGKVVVVEHLPYVTSSSIHIPETVRGISGPVKAVVLAVGAKSEHINDLKKHDLVIVPQQLGNRMTIDSIPAIIYDDEDILARVDP